MSIFSLPAKIIDCPINVYFTIDTSETIALQEPPPGSLVASIKNFARVFAERLDNTVYNNQVRFTWSIGGLHYSQRQEIFCELTSKDIFIRNVSRIVYFGKGTYTDCALRRMTQKITERSSEKAVNFSVVITDGHVTGSPCGGMKRMAARAQDLGIQLFAVPPTRIIDETGLKEIASSPYYLFAGDYVAVNLTGGRPEISELTIQRIIKAMVI